MRRQSAVVTLVLGVLLLGLTYAAAQRGGTPPTQAVGSESTTVAAAATDALSADIAKLQGQLDERPEDAALWAQLGGLYVEQARVSADPSYYPRAEGALTTSLELQPEGNDDALTGMGALSNARHEFEDAADYARQAQEINAADATSWGVLADALIQLGDYPGATEATQQMLDIRPGLPSYSRASYDLELHGQPERAREAMELALSSAFSQADIAFCRYYLGQLAFNAGDLDGAQEQFEVGLAAVPDDPTLLVGMARVDAARGNVEVARQGYDRVVAARPLPEYLIEYGHYLQSLGEDEAAAEQFAVYEVAESLFSANGVQDDRTAALVEAERGDPAVALEHAEAEYERRQNVESADAMAWALHTAGRDEEALKYAVEATALEGPNAAFLYHRGMIEASLGREDEARASLQAALDTNPYFSPLDAPRAQEALSDLGTPG